MRQSKYGTRDPEIVRLRGKLRTDDAEKKRQAYADLERYKRQKRVREAEELLRGERRRALVAAGLDPDVEVDDGGAA